MHDERKHPLAYSIAQLNAICNTTSAKEFDSYLGVFMRVFSVPVTRLLLCTRVTPNIITTVSVVVYFAGLSMFYFGTFFGNLWGCFLIFLSVLLDACDGEIARFRGTAGVLGGMYVEPVSHDIQYGLGFLWVAILLVAHGAPHFLLIVGAMAGITKLMTRLLRYHFSYILKQSSTTQVSSDENAAPVSSRQRFAIKMEKQLFSSVSVIPLLLIGTMLGRIDWVIWYYGVFYTALWLLVFLKQIYSIRVRGIV